VLKTFCQNNGQFSSVGDATASHASPSRTRVRVPRIIHSE